jgi:hypothetical protein
VLNPQSNYIHDETESIMIALQDRAMAKDVGFGQIFLHQIPAIDPNQLTARLYALPETENNDCM